MVSKIERCIDANELSFNILNSLYCQEMIKEVCNYRRRLKQPLTYEIQTCVLKDELESINVIEATQYSYGHLGEISSMLDDCLNRTSTSLFNDLVN